MRIGDLVRPADATVAWSCGCLLTTGAGEAGVAFADAGSSCETPVTVIASPSDRSRRSASPARTSCLAATQPAAGALSRTTALVHPIITEATAVPLSPSRLSRWCPAAKAVPPQPDATTLLSNQLIEHVTVSFAPIARHGSRATGAPTANVVPASGSVIATAGLALLTATYADAVAAGLMPSFTVKVTMNAPSSLH